MRIDRERHATAEEDLDRLPDPTDASSSNASVLVTVGKGAGPGSVYSCTTCTATFDETEGASPTITCGSPTIYALNVGTEDPGSGTQLLVYDVVGRYAFRYDG